MSGADQLAKVAKPGDPDLILDVDGATLVTLVVHGTEIIARFEGGFGEFDATDGTRAIFPPGDPVAAVTEMNLVAGFTDPNLEWFNAMVERLDRWCAQAVPLRICIAHGRMISVIEDRNCWLPFPNNSPTSSDPEA